MVMDFTSIPGKIFEDMFCLLIIPKLQNYEFLKLHNMSLVCM